MLFNFLRTRSVGDGSSDITENNIRYLYIEIFFAGIMGAITVTYNSLFVVHFVSDPTLAATLSGVLTAAPALIAILLSIPSAGFLDRKKRRVAWLFGSLWFIRIGMLVIVLLPFAFHDSTAAILLVIWLVVLSIPVPMFSNGFNALLAELIPQKRRAFVFSRRAIIYSLVITFTLPITGLWLNFAPFPINFQIVYLAGAIFIMGSQYFLLRLVIPPNSTFASRGVSVPTVTADPAFPKVRAPLTPLFRKMLINSLVYQLGLQISGPLFVIYYVNTLKVSDGLISVNTAVGTFGVVFGQLLWEAVMRKRSYAWVLRTATLGTFVFPFVVAFSHQFWLIILANFVVNILHPAVDLSSLNVIFSWSTPKERNMYMSYYMTAISISAFVAPLVAVPLAGLISIPGVMLIAAALRFSGGLLYRFNRAPEPVSV
jgi:MFS family permease